MKIFKVCNMTTEIVTVEGFINNYLIKRIGEIKKDNPYFAFLLMAVGIEFLGQCLNDETEFNKGKSRNNFGLGLTVYPLNKSEYSNLYEDMRCGLAHSLQTKNGLCMSNTKCKGTIDCETFYVDFEAACKEILSGKVTMPKKKLSDTFFVVTTNDDGTSTTGNTLSQMSLVQN